MLSITTNTYHTPRAVIPPTPPKGFKRVEILQGDFGEETGFISSTSFPDGSSAVKGVWGDEDIDFTTKTIEENGRKITHKVGDTGEETVDLRIEVKEGDNPVTHTYGTEDGKPTNLIFRKDDQGDIHTLGIRKGHDVNLVEGFEDGVLFKKGDDGEHDVDYKTTREHKYEQPYQTTLKEEGDFGPAYGVKTHKVEHDFESMVTKEVLDEEIGGFRSHIRKVTTQTGTHPEPNSLILSVTGHHGEKHVEYTHSIQNFHPPTDEESGASRRLEKHERVGGDFGDAQGNYERHVYLVADERS